MIKVMGIWVVDRKDRGKILFSVENMGATMEFSSKEELVAFEEKLEAAFKHHIGEDLEVLSHELKW